MYTLIFIAGILILVFTILAYTLLNKNKTWFKKLIAGGVSIGIATAGMGIFIPTGDAPIDEIIDEPYIFYQSTINGGFSYYKVNETFYRNWLNTTIIWKVEKSIDGSKWTDYKKFEIKKDWNEKELSEKHTVIVNSDEDAYYRILTNTVAGADLKGYDDLSAKSIEEGKSNDYSLSFKVSDTRNYDLKYNWDDYLNSPIASTSTFSKQVKTDSITSKQVFEFSVVSSVKIKSGDSFILDPTYGLIGDATTDSFEYENTNGQFPAMIRHNQSNYYIIVYAGQDSDGWINVTWVNDTGTINSTGNRCIDSWEYDITDGLTPNILWWGGNTYLVSYCDATGNLDNVFTFSLYDNGTIQKSILDITAFTYESLATAKASLLRIGGNLFAYAQTDITTSDGFLYTFFVNASNDISPIVDSFEFDVSFGLDPQMCMVDSNTLAIVWDGVDNDGHMMTINVTSGGDISSTNSSWWEFDITKAEAPTISKVTGNIFMIAFEDSSSDMIVKTCQINDTGSIWDTWIDTQVLDATLGDYPTFFNVSVNAIANKWIKGITFSGEGSDGYVSTFDVTNAGVIGSEIDTLEILPADTVGWYMPVCWVNGFYFLSIIQDSAADGWAKTFEIYANNPPNISNPSPTDGATGVSATPQLSADIADIGDYYLNSSWYSNSSGSWTQFGGVNSTMGYGAISDANINTWEYDTNSAAKTDTVKLGSDTIFSYYATVYYVTDNDGWINTTKVWNNNGTIYPAIIDSYEYDTTDGYGPSICWISGDIYAIVYYDATGLKEKVVTVSISSSGDIDTVTGVIDTLQLTYDGYYLNTYANIIRVIGNVFSVFYENSVFDSTIDTIWINNSGTINDSVLDTQTIYAAAAGFANAGVQVMIDSDTVAIAHYTTAATIGTYNITNAGVITNTAADSWAIGGGGVLYYDMILINSNILLIAYSVGTLKTVEIANTGMITKIAIDTLIFDAAAGTFISILSLENNLYAVTYQGSSTDGFIKTIYITNAGDIACFEYDFLEFDTGNLVSFANILSVANDYYYIIYVGVDTDGWTATVKIENSTNTTISQPNTNFSAASTKYWWSVNTTDDVQWTNQTYSFTTISETLPITDIYNRTVRTNGIDYFTWLGDNTTASVVKTNITGMDEAIEYLAILYDNGTWMKYYGDGTGTNWNIHTYDIVRSYMDDVAGNITFNMSGNQNINYTYSRTVNLIKIGNGYNYTGYVNSTGTTNLSNINTTLTLATGYSVGVWNRTIFDWDVWISGFGTMSGIDYNVTKWDVVYTKIEADKTWVM